MYKKQKYMLYFGIIIWLTFFLRCFSIVANRLSRKWSHFLLSCFYPLRSRMCFEIENVRNCVNSSQHHYCLFCNNLFRIRKKIGPLKPFSFSVNYCISFCWKQVCIKLLGCGQHAGVGHTYRYSLCSHRPNYVLSRWTGSQVPYRTSLTQVLVSPRANLSC